MTKIFLPTFLPLNIMIFLFLGMSALAQNKTQQKIQGEIFDKTTDEPLNEKKRLLIAPIEGEKFLREDQIKQLQKIAVREIINCRDFRLVVAGKNQSHFKRKFFALKIKITRKKEFSIHLQIFDQQKRVVTREYKKDLIPKLNLILRLEEGIRALLSSDKLKKRSVFNNIKVPVEPSLRIFDPPKKKKKREKKVNKEIASLKESIDEELKKESEGTPPPMVELKKGESLAEAPPGGGGSGIFLNYAKLQGVFLGYNQQTIYSKDLFTVKNNYQTMDFGLNARLLEDFLSMTELYFNFYTGKVLNSPTYTVPTRLGFGIDLRMPLFNKYLSFYGGVSQENISYVNSNEFGKGLIIQENQMRWFSYGAVLEWNLVFSQWVRVSNSNFMSASSTYDGESVELNFQGNKSSWEYFVNISKSFSIGIFGETISLVGESDARVLTVEKSDIGAEFAYHF